MGLGCELDETKTRLDIDEDNSRQDREAQGNPRSPQERRLL